MQGGMGLEEMEGGVEMGWVGLVGCRAGSRRDTGGHAGKDGRGIGKDGAGSDVGWIGTGGIWGEMGLGGMCVGWDWGGRDRAAGDAGSTDLCRTW